MKSMTGNRLQRTGRVPRLLLVLALGWLLAAGAQPGPARAAGDRTQDLIRSAMIYNFCKFVQWPADTLGDSIVLGVLAGGDDQPDFSSLAGKSVGEVPLAVRVVKTEEDLRNCQLLYIADSAQGRLGDTLAVARAESILTISDRNRFCQDGGIIQLVERRGKLRFFINRKAADSAQLALSSQLLKVAKIVEGS